MAIVVEELNTTLPSKLPVYDVVASPWSEREMTELAGRFGIDGPLSASRHRTCVRGTGESLEFFTASRSVRWSLATADSSEPTSPINLDTRAAIRRAMEFLEKRDPGGDWTRNAVRSSVDDMRVARMDRGASVPGESICTGKCVNFTYRLEHEGHFYDVTGPGAKMQVVVGHDGKVREFYRFWREPRFRETCDRKSARGPRDRIVSALKRTHGRGLKSKEVDAKVVWGVTFPMLPPREQQQTLEPYYELNIRQQGFLEEQPVEIVRWARAVDSFGKEHEWTKAMGRAIL
jgi:hypothetical protein